jgi:hypothetical protein
MVSGFFSVQSRIKVNVTARETIETTPIYGGLT